MGENTKIEWATHTFNPWIGCNEVSPECDNCYARTLAERYGWAKWGVGEPRHRTSDANWRKPLAWDRAAAKSGERPRVFCASLADVFDNDVRDSWRDELFTLIRDTPNLDWLLLTKRPGRARQYLTDVRNRKHLCTLAEGCEAETGYCAEPWPLPNVWMGASVGHPDTKWRIDGLRKMPAAVRFLSCEPLLGDLGELDLSGIDWVICGGESGPTARPMHPDWTRSVRDQCVKSGVPFFFKQWGEYGPTDYLGNGTHWAYGKGKFANWIRERDAWHESSIPGGSTVLARVGKKEAGRLLDGRLWNEFPFPTPASGAQTK